MVKNLTIALLLAFITLPVIAQSNAAYVPIMSRFEQWKATQYKKGTYETAANCNTENVTKSMYKGPGVGIPDDISVVYTDLNTDKRLDALITFTPELCSGGNALMNAQARVLIVSDGATYRVDDTSIDKIEKTLKEGWLTVEQANEGTFSGTYHAYKEGDGHCCPSINRPFEIDYKTKKLTYTDKR